MQPTMLSRKSSHNWLPCDIDTVVTLFVDARLNPILGESRYFDANPTPHARFLGKVPL